MRLLPSTCGTHPFPYEHSQGQFGHAEAGSMSSQLVHLDVVAVATLK